MLSVVLTTLIMVLLFFLPILARQHHPQAPVRMQQQTLRLRCCAVITGQTADETYTYNQTGRQSSATGTGTTTSWA
jgi:hypothetical protein